MMNQLIFHSRLRIIMIITKQPLSLPNSNIKTQDVRSLGLGNVGMHLRGGGGALRL